MVDSLPLVAHVSAMVPYLDPSTAAEKAKGLLVGESKPIGLQGMFLDVLSVALEKSQSKADLALELVSMGIYDITMLRRQRALPALGVVPLEAVPGFRSQPLNLVQADPPFSEAGKT